MKTKFAIGCLVQWYEIDIIKEYAESLKDAIKSYDGEVLVDMMLVLNQELEKTTLSESEFAEIKGKIFEMFHDIQRVNDNCLVLVNSTNSLYTIADYRREFNNKHCTNADVLIWGETDMLVPKQAFQVLDFLHQQVSDQTPKYLATFGICKMWDVTWKPLEHVDFTDKPFIENDYTNWWSLKYTMNADEMNKINDKVDELQVNVVAPYKFNGCGLVIASEVIKSGVNIPKSMFFVHEDTAFMLMTQKLLGNIPQYHFKNWYVKANSFSEQNCYNLFNPNYKSLTWKDVYDKN